MLVRKVELKKWGNSQGIRIGKDELDELGLNRESTIFEMTVEEGKITLVPQKEYPETLEELFADYTGEPLPKEDRFDWGEAVGKEQI